MYAPCLASDLFSMQLRRTRQSIDEHVLLRAAAGGFRFTGQTQQADQVLVKLEPYGVIAIHVGACEPPVLAADHALQRMVESARVVG